MKWKEALQIRQTEDDNLTLMESASGKLRIAAYTVYPGITLQYITSHVQNVTFPHGPDRTYLPSIIVKRAGSSAISRTGNTCIWERAICPSAGGTVPVTATVPFSRHPTIMAYP